MTRRIRPASFTRFGVMFLAACALVPAQRPPTGWRRANDAPPQQAERLPDESAQADAFGQPLGQPGLRPPDGQIIPPPPMPPQLTLAPGKFITVRLNQGLSSDRNQPGDPFSATLTEPLVIDGVVVAQRGQTVFGRVAQAQRAKASQPSGLGLELTGITLVDGTQATVRTQLVGRHGGS